MTGDCWSPAEFRAVKRGKVTSFIRLDCDENLLEKVFDLPNLRANVQHVDGRSGRGQLIAISANEVGPEKVLVRHYIHGGAYGRIAGDLFADSQRPLKELNASEIARKNDVPTAEIIAIRQEEVIKLFYRFDLFSKEIPNSVDLIEFLAESSSSPPMGPNTKESLPQRVERLKRKRRVITLAGKAIRRMHDAGIYHADLHLKNILVQCPLPSRDITDYKVFIIDFDKAEVKEHLSLEDRMKNLTRLERSTQKWPRVRRSISSSDKLRFFNAYSKNDEALIGRRKEILRRLGRRHILHKLLWRLLRLT